MKTIFWKKNVIFDRKLLILIFFRNSLSKIVSEYDQEIPLAGNRHWPETKAALFTKR